MLLTQTIIQKWNSKNVKHYVNLGYSYTHINDEFECRVEDLPHGSRVSIECVCDYCLLNPTHDIMKVGNT